MCVCVSPPTVGLDGHGPIQPAYPHHLGDQFPHLPVALPQSQPVDVHARQPRLPRPQRQTEGGMELKVITMSMDIHTCYVRQRVDLLQLSPKILTVSPHISCDILSDSLVGCIVCVAVLAVCGNASGCWQHGGKSMECWFLNVFFQPDSISHCYFEQRKDFDFYSFHACSYWV